jgi:hypothetical protein
MAAPLDGLRCSEAISPHVQPLANTSDTVPIGTPKREITASFSTRRPSSGAMVSAKSSRVTLPSADAHGKIYDFPTGNLLTSQPPG